jgi:hypothetical protein
MYLIDSICKNVGGKYIQPLSTNIIKTFSIAFAAVSSDDKRRLHRLLDTWRTNPINNGPPIFNTHILNQLYQIVNATTATPSLNPTSNALASFAPVKPLDLNVNRVKCCIVRFQVLQPFIPFHPTPISD